MRQCWDQEPEQRPPFNKIKFELEEVTLSFHIRLDSGHRTPFNSSADANANGTNSTAADCSAGRMGANAGHHSVPRPSFDAAQAQGSDEEGAQSLYMSASRPAHVSY